MVQVEKTSVTSAKMFLVEAVVEEKNNKAIFGLGKQTCRLFKNHGSLYL